MRKLNLLMILAAGLYWSGCGDTDKLTQPPDPTEHLREMIAQTPRADEEAEMAAMWLSDQLVAPESLYLEIRNALKEVRRQFGPGNFALYNLHFAHDWSQKKVLPLLTSAGKADYRAGMHRDIDSLTELLNGEVIDTFYFDFNGSFEVRIHFPGCLNIDSVQNMYLNLASVGAIDHYGGIGDFPNVYPWQLPDGRLTLLFREAWGDCPSGCIYSHFWYFRIDGDSIEYVGEYIRDWEQPEQPEPDWWEEAKAGYYHFEHYDLLTRSEGRNSDWNCQNRAIRSLRRD